MWPVSHDTDPMITTAVWGRARARVGGPHGAGDERAVPGVCEETIMAEVRYENATCIYPGAERPAVVR